MDKLLPLFTVHGGGVVAASARRGVSLRVLVLAALRAPARAATSRAADHAQVGVGRRSRFGATAGAPTPRVIRTFIFVQFRSISFNFVRFRTISFDFRSISFDAFAFKKAQLWGRALRHTRCMMIRTDIGGHHVRPFICGCFFIEYPVRIKGERENFFSFIFFFKGS